MKKKKKKKDITILITIFKQINNSIIMKKIGKEFIVNILSIIK
jgi:hypothetical protein